MYKVKQRVNKLLKPKMRAISDRGLGKKPESKEEKAKGRAARLEEAKKKKAAKAK